MGALIHDVRYGLRLLARAPVFTLTAIVTLALGIGANAAIFSLISAVLIRPLPYGAPDELVLVWEHNLVRNRPTNVVSPGNYLHWRDMSRSFSDLAAVTMPAAVTVTGRGEPAQVMARYVTSGLFPLLRVQPVLGRTFSEPEDRRDADVVVLSHAFWQSRYGGQPGLVGQAITLNGRSYTVLGVMPPGFQLPDAPNDVWLPIGFTAETRTPRGRSLFVLGRLGPGVTAAQAQDDMTRVAAELTRMFPAFNTGWTVNVVPLARQVTGKARAPLLTLLGAVGFVLLIACANIANLLLAQGSARAREFAVRAALGAGRARIVRQLLVESLLLAGFGALGGLALATGAVGLLRSVLSARLPLPQIQSLSVDQTTLLLTIGVAMVCGLGFGLVPALTSSQVGLLDGLKEGGRAGAGARSSRVRAFLVIAEVALALVLLVGAGLLMRSFARLVEVPTGLQPDRVLTFRLGVPGERYDESQRVTLFRDLVGQLERLPDVTAAGAVSFLPLDGLAAATKFTVIGRPAPPVGEEPVCDVRVITGDYFSAMGIPLVQGRGFTNTETPETSHRVVINQTMARQMWPGENPLGKRISVSWTDDAPQEVIGVVGDVREEALQTAARPAVYWPHPRTPYTRMIVVARTRGEPMSIVAAATSVVRRLDPQLAVADVRTMQSVVARSVADRRLLMFALSLFAGLALLLAAVGIYGVISYVVVQRTAEIGVRMALGASRAQVIVMVVRSAGLLAAAGIAIGVAVSFAVTRALRTLLFDVTPYDPLTFAAVAAVVALVALCASAVPAARAARIDPVAALKAE